MAHHFQFSGFLFTFFTFLYQGFKGLLEFSTSQCLYGMCFEGSRDVKSCKLYLQSAYPTQQMADDASGILLASPFHMENLPDFFFAIKIETPIKDDGFLSKPCTIFREQKLGEWGRPNFLKPPRLQLPSKQKSSRLPRVPPQAVCVFQIVG